MNMEPASIITKLEANADVFSELLSDLSEEEITWKISTDKWCLLEIICHLRDEEVEDFRARVNNSLHTPEKDPPKIDPVGWVKSRNYMDQSFEDKLASFLREREGSVLWLHSLDEPDWDSAWNHPELGPQSARHYLHNWLAHDYLHIRQITRVKYDYLREKGGIPVNYAGNWV